MIRFLKILLGAGLCLIIYWQLKKNISQMDDFGTLQIQPFIIFSAILLMPLNWTLEALKWQKLLKPLADISLKNSIKSILSGVSLGLFTPARIGEYGGRMITIQDDLRIPSMAATLYGSIAQNSIHVLAGIGLGGVFLIEKFSVPTPEVNDYLILVWLFLTVFILFFLFPLIWVKLVTCFSRFRHLTWLQNFLYVRNVTIKDASVLLLLSGMRYSVYFTQYFLILKSLGVSLSISKISPGIAGIFLLQSGLPLPPVLQFLGRGEISILVWQHFGINAPIALSAAILLWVINLVFPAIAGYILIITPKAKT